MKVLISLGLKSWGEDGCKIYFYFYYIVKKLDASTLYIFYNLEVYIFYITPAPPPPLQDR